MTESKKSAGNDLVVVGSSAGGVSALSTLVSTLRKDFPAPIVLAQHLDPQRHPRIARTDQSRTRGVASFRLGPARW